jgi:hypothetical protein
MGYPRVTNNVLSMAGGGMEYPTTSRRMGLLAPTTPLIAAVPDLALAKGVAKVTLDDTTLSELSSDYPIKLSFSSDTGVTWTEKTVAVAGAKAASVTLSASDLAEVKPSYGVYVSLTDGATKVRCRINGKVDADPASVTIPASGFDTIGYMGEVRVSLDGGETYDVATYTSQDKVTAARLARLIDGVMGNKIITQVVGSAVRLSTTTSGAGVSLLVYYGRPGSYTELYATGSDGSLTNAAAIVAAAINADASALVTATAVSGTVVVTALRLGARIKLWVAWGPDVTARHTSTGQAVRPTNVASAIDAVAGLSAVVVGTAVMVSTDAAGDKMALKVQWGDDPWQVRTANGTTKDPGTPTTRVYTYTYVNKEADITIESAPWVSTDMSSATVSVYAGDVVNLSGFGEPPADEGWYYTHVRIYCAVGGTFLYVGEQQKPVTSYTDTKTALEFGEACPSITWSAPSPDMKGLINLPNGIMAGFEGRDVYFCEPYRPYAWPAAYQQTVDYPVVGLGRLDTSLVVLTKGAPYLISGSAPGYMTVVKADLEQACVSKRSIVSMGSAVFYASPDGLVALAASGSRVLTDVLFDRADWQALAPSTIHAYGHEDKYIAFHAPVLLDGEFCTGFVVDLKSSQFIRHNIPNIVGGYTDLRNDHLYLVDTSKAIKRWGDGASLVGRWRSKVFTLPQITGFSCAQVEAETYSGVACAIYCDGAKLTTELTVSNDLVGTTSARRIDGRYPFRLAPLQGRDWEVDLTVTQEIFHVAVAQAMAEIATGDEEG